MNQYMLMFSLGPVQPFIEQARKTRDLWLGSFLLSKLMEEAMEGIEEPGVQFVFPSYRKIDAKGDTEYANLSNKYIAIFDDADKAEKAARKSKDQIHVFWNALRADIKEKMIQWCADEETDKIWERQSNPEACFEIRWVIVEGDTGNYKAWLKDTEEALESRKRLHNFLQREEPGEKSTISGERQALRRAASGSASDRQQVRAFWEVLTNRKDRPPSLSAKEISLDGSERLDAIDTIKRFATKSSRIGERSFPSTSSIATASFVEGLLLAKLDESDFQAWRGATKGSLVEIATSATNAIPRLQRMAGENKWILRRDGDCYFRATFTPYRLEKDYGVRNEHEANGIAIEGRKGLEKLFEAADERGLRHPTPYYAILKMDGDRMGNLLNTAGSPEEHRQISDALSIFTRKDVPALVNENYPGRLVYAGGDDVLALAPLARNLPGESNSGSEVIKTIIDLADRLQSQYRTRIERGATASISIAIAHHYAPLSFVLGVMRRAERQLAKKRYGRSALVVSVIRRSGAQTQVGCRWEYKQLEKYPNSQQPMKLFSRLYDLFAWDILSPKCVHILLEEAPALVRLNPNAQASEIRRVLLRQRSDAKRNDLPDAEAGNLAKSLAWLAEAVNNEHGWTGMSAKLEEDGLRDGLVEVLGWLLVMTFLTRKEED